MPSSARLIALFLALCAPLASAQFAEEILSVSIPEEDKTIIASDVDNADPAYDRDTAKATVETLFDRGGAGAQLIQDYRYRIRLADPDGTLVPLNTLSGTPSTTVFRNVTVIYPNGQAQVTQDHELVIKPTAQLDVNVFYKWQIELQRQTGGGGFVPADDAESFNIRYWHFTGTNPVGGKRNILGYVRALNFTRPYALASASDPDGQSFEAEVTYEVRRYDGWDLDSPATHDIEFQLEGRIHEDSSDNDVGSSTHDFTLALPQHTDVAGRTEPYVESITRTILIAPDSQIATATEVFYAKTDLLHIEIAGSATYITDSTGRTGGSFPLLHFNGQLVSLGDAATMTALGPGSESPATQNGDHRLTRPVITGGTVNGHPDQQISTGGDIDIHLFDDGRAEVAEFPGVAITPPQPLLDLDEVNGIRFQRQNTTLGPLGFSTDLQLVLPAGLGVYDRSPDDISQRLLAARLTAAIRIPLTGDLAPEFANLFFAPVETFVFVEESKPLEYLTGGLQWDVANGRLILDPASTTVRYIRRDELEVLERSPLPAEDKVVRSNELYFRHVSGTTPVSPVFGPDTQGSALTRVTVDLDPGSLLTHFPYNSEIAWDGNGLLEIVADKPVPAGSSLTMAQPIEVPWARDCELPPEANCGTIGDALSRLDPTGGIIGITADGGLAAKGAMLSGSGARRDVVMGYIDVLSATQQTYAHDTQIFDSGSLLTAGHFLATGETTDTPSADAPGALLNSGINPNNLTQAERPGTPAYRDGLADYPGVNFRVADEATPPSATSTLGGVQSPIYTLGNRSKYYARQSGVTGIHEPASNPFVDPLLIYGYEFTFTQFGLSFLSSEMKDSVTAGSLYIPGVQTPASGFDVAFDPIGFSCLGGLTEMKLDGGPFEHRLNFWDADIRGVAAAFQPAIGAECDPSDAYFTLGVEASASNIAEPLGGTLGFKPDGNLITKADALLETVDSRLKLPSQISIKGPGSEIYAFYPEHDAYYDNFDHATDSSGGLNFAGTLDVAYFEDLETHFQVAAQRDDLLTPIHMMGGWPEDGYTQFSATEFDLDHRGYPQSSNRTDYRAGDTGRPITAHQELFGVAELNYDVSWDTTTRSFASTEPKGIDLLVISTEDECVYLSSEVAELDFGASIQLDIPEVNFANLAEGTPVYDALHAAADTVTEEIVDGLAQGEELLNDLMDEFYDDLFDAVVEPELDALAAGLQALGDDAAAIENKIANDLGATVSDLPTEAIAKVDARIDAIQTGIENVRNGIFGESGGRYVVAETVLRELVGQLQPDTDENLDQNGGYDDLPSAFSERSGTIEQVKATLDSLDATLESIQTTGHLAQELADAFADGSFVTEAREAIIKELVGKDLSDYTTDELKDILRAELRDALDSSALFAKVSEVLRAYLYELNGAMHEAIDSGFQQINRVIADILDDFLPIDRTLEGFLGDLAELCFNGRVDGYARINGDALRTLRLDTEIQARLPDAFEFDGYIEINQLDSSGTQTCIVGPTNSDVFTEVKMGAAAVPVQWGGSELAFDIDTKFSFAPQLRGMAGAFEMVEGNIDFEAMKINELGAAAAFGLDENYLAAKVGIIFDGNRMYGGVFFGRTCTYDPLRLVDPDVENVLPEPPLSGAYGYGEAEIPIINVGCLFRVSARAGAGIFVFDADGTEVIGGKILLGANGRVICAVEAGGEVELIGAKVGNDFNFFGKGRIYGCAGKKPLKVSFDKSVSITFKNKKWDYDY